MLLSISEIIAFLQFLNWIVRNVPKPPQTSIHEHSELPVFRWNVRAWAVRPWFHGLFESAATFGSGTNSAAFVFGAKKMLRSVGQTAFHTRTDRRTVKEIRIDGPNYGR